MAAITLGVETDDTSNVDTYTTASFTPAANDLLLACALATGTVDAGAYTSSDAGKTYSKVTQALYGTSVHSAYAFVADQLADADSQTGTLDVTGDTASGCAQLILRVSGMTNTGASAIRQYKIVENQAASGTPEVIFDSACLTGNPTIMIVAKGATTDVTAPTSWTSIGTDGAYGTPNSKLKVFARDSGFTGTTITAGGTSDGVYCVIGIELDASSGSTYTLDAAAASYTYTATAAGLEHGYLIDAASATYTYTATAATLTRDMPLVPDAAAYTWTANDATLEYTRAYTLDAAAAAYAWTANDATFDYTGAPRSQTLTYGAAPHTLAPDKVRRKWEEIEEIDRRIAAKEAAERENIRKQEEAKRQLADLEEKKRQTKTIAERKRKLQARIDAYEAEIADLRETIQAMLDEIEQAKVAYETEMQIADRRRRMFLLLAAAS